jgi:DNA-binding transcriptional ArsR family regulator
VVFPPGWNSIDTTTRIHNVLEIYVLVLLGLLALSEAFAYVYGHHREALLSAAVDRRSAEVAIGERNAAETTATQNKLEAPSRQLTDELPPRNLARHLSDLQKAELVKALSAFAGQKISVWCSAKAWDSTLLGRDFLGVLKQSNWDVPNDPQNGSDIGGDLLGVQITGSGNTQATNQVPPGIVVLLATLTRLGVTQNILYQDEPIKPGGYLLKIGRIAPAR